MIFTFFFYLVVITFISSVGVCDNSVILTAVIVCPAAEVCVPCQSIVICRFDVRRVIMMQLFGALESIYCTHCVCFIAFVRQIMMQLLRF